MHNRKGVVTCIVLLLLTSSVFTFQSVFVEQWELFEDFTKSFKENPGAIFIVIVVWFALMVFLIYLSIRVTPWFGVMCLLLAFGVGYWYISSNMETETAPPEEARNSIISYIKDQYPNTVRLFDDVEWSGDDITSSELVGEAKYQYLDGGWNITISWAIVAKPTFEVRAEYCSPTGDLSIFWEGIVDQKGVVEEKIKGYYQSVESVRDIVMDYIINTLPDITVNNTNLVWSIAPQEPVPGWTTYTYLCDGWNVTISYEIHYDITYFVTVENRLEEITWTGTVYDGVVDEGGT